MNLSLSLAFVNKMDRVGADLYKAIKSLQDELFMNPALLQLPYHINNEEFEGVIDLISMNLFLWPSSLDSPNKNQPNDPLIYPFIDIINGDVSDFPYNLEKNKAYHLKLFEEIKEKRNNLMDLLSLYDEEFMELCLEKSYDEILINEIIPVIRRYVFFLVLSFFLFLTNFP